MSTYPTEYTTHLCRFNSISGSRQRYQAPSGSNSGGSLNLMYIPPKWRIFWQIIPWLDINRLIPTQFFLIVSATSHVWFYVFKKVICRTYIRKQFFLPHFNVILLVAFVTKWSLCMNYRLEGNFKKMEKSNTYIVSYKQTKHKRKKCWESVKTLTIFVESLNFLKLKLIKKTIMLLTLSRSIILYEKVNF